jgi:hypothetical protein
MLADPSRLAKACWADFSSSPLAFRSASTIFRASDFRSSLFSVIAGEVSTLSSLRDSTTLTSFDCWRICSATYLADLSSARADSALDRADCSADSAFCAVSKSLTSAMDRKESKSVNELRRKKQVRRNGGLPSRSISWSFRFSRIAAAWRQYCKASVTAGADETIALVGGGCDATVTFFGGSPLEGFLQIDGLLEQINWSHKQENASQDYHVLGRKYLSHGWRLRFLGRLDISSSRSISSDRLGDVLKSFKQAPEYEIYGNQC